MTIVLQISDTHIAAHGRLVSDKLDTASAFESLVKRIIQIRSEIGKVDAIIASGDISDDGTANSYEIFKNIIEKLDIPTFVIPGNHDSRSRLRDAFSVDGYLPKVGKLNWHVPLADFHLIGLDSLVEGMPGGEVDTSTLAFLSDKFEALDSAPVLLALHHPPFKSGIKFMDEIGLQGVRHFHNVLKSYNGEVRLICGHIHNLMVMNVAGHVALSAPAPTSSFSYNLQDNALKGFMRIEDGFLLHRWSNGFQSVRISTHKGEGPFPF